MKAKYLSLIIAVALFATTFAEPDRRAKSISITINDQGQFDINRIRSDMENNGMFVSYRISGRDGMEWPKGESTYINFASGIWLAGKVDGNVRTALAEYGSEFSPGPAGSDPSDPKHRLYKINRGDQLTDDVLEWPVDVGAPWIDADGDGIYDPYSGDRPDILGDQMIWYVMNDLDTAQHVIFNTLPLGVEVQMSIWGYNNTISNDMMFVKALIIHKGDTPIDSAYIGIWDDPDLGDAGDDFVGCDTTLGLGYCYNDGPDSDYGDNPPAMGYDFFRGPMVPSLGDTAKAFGRIHTNYKNLQMTAFNKGIGESSWGVPYAEEVYYLMQGLNRSGDPIINSETGVSTKFMYADDPNQNTGIGDGIWVDSDDRPSGDRRFLMSSGPFTMAPGDSQEVIFAVIIARGTDALNSVTELKKADEIAQRAFDMDFKTELPHQMDRVAVTPFRESILLNWQANSAAAESFTTEALFGEDTSGNPATYTFQGYNVYQLETAAGQGEMKRIATFDIVDGVTEIWDDVFDADYGNYVYVRTQYGSDNGLQHHMIIDKDVLNNDTPLLSNREYYFAVTAYAYSENAVPKTIESEKEILIVRPGTSTQFIENENQSLLFQADHIAGYSDGIVSILVVDPLEITGHDYEVRFRQKDSSLVVWDMFDITDDRQVVFGESNQGGIDHETSVNEGFGASPIVDGLQVHVNLIEDGLRGIWQTQNANGEIPGVGENISENILWINFLTAPDYPTQQAQGGWAFVTYGGGTTNDWDSFYSSVFPGDNFDRAMSREFEIRFTANGGKALMFDSSLAVVDVPFECWNLGTTPDDPSDDFRMINWVFDINGDNIFNLSGDDPSSNSNNDPSSDWIYWRNPTDMTPGQAGYEACANAEDYGYEAGASGEEVMARTRLMNWNRYLGGGDIIGGTGGALDSAAAEQAMPEVGTIYRWIMNKPNLPGDVYFFSTDSLKPKTFDYSPQRINVWPNPYFAYNPEERTPSERKVMFTHLPAEATIRIFDLAGNLIRIIQHTDGTQYETWDLRNMANRRISSGIYIAHIETASGDQILKIAVIQPRD
ncbi:MAG: T9SS type A sorting domain-containing protein [Candidatus Marinimicrobia bacterium]|nr:T9SS type A sorting domain-containing protein [Candidatus Neomarinimicrobiota bacterium]